MGLLSTCFIEFTLLSVCTFILTNFQFLHNQTETDEQRAARYATGESVNLSDLAEDVTRPSASDNAQEAASRAKAGVAGAAEDAKAKAESTYEAAKDKTAEAADAIKGRVGDAGAAVSDTFHQVAEKISEGVQAAGDKARWTVEHAQEEVSKGMSKLQEDMEPATPEEAAIAHGEIPSDTQTQRTKIL